MKSGINLIEKERLMSATNTNIYQNVPKNPDNSKKYLFYLHGLIVEEAGIRPKSEEHGYYEYELIIKAFARQGFVVVSEARPQGTQVKPYAEIIVSQVKTLLVAGVPAENITIAGASKGGIIAAYISNMLQDKEIHYIFLAGLFEKCLVDDNLSLYGQVLSIHDRSDKLSITPDLYFERSEGQGTFKKVILNLDLGHGLIYQPHPEWMQPIIEWMKL
ncbi:MAG: hypothetical protein ACI8ZB_001422 [Desulforhopalus sp.]|jgi:hypothetical protein